MGLHLGSISAWDMWLLSLSDANLKEAKDPTSTPAVINALVDMTMWVSTCAPRCGLC